MSQHHFLYCVLIQEDLQDFSAGIVFSTKLSTEDASINRSILNFFFLG
jgi:hypothetical protein